VTADFLGLDLPGWGEEGGGGGLGGRGGAGTLRCEMMGWRESGGRDLLMGVMGRKFGGRVLLMLEVEMGVVWAALQV
jgi:hypothetical protein